MKSTTCNHKRERSETTISLTLPTSWQTLTVRQLRYVFFLLSQGYTATELKTYCLLRWANITVINSDRQFYLVRYQKHSYRLTALQIAELLPYLDFLDTIPATPICLPVINKCRAVSPDLDGVPFRDYLICDNIYTGFLQTRNDTLLHDIAAILYRTDRLRLKPEETLSIFYWFASLKNYYRNRFPSLFSPSTTTDTAPIQQRLQAAMDNQIRALTHGDITKETQVLTSDTLRALTELDALAHDYQQLQKDTQR